MRRKQRENRWPIAASLLVHSLFIGLALGFAAFGTRMVFPDAVIVTIVSSIKGDSEAGQIVQKTDSRPRVIAETNEAKPEQFEEEKVHDAQFPMEPAEGTDQAGTTEEAPVAPPPSGDHGRTETAELSGVGPDSTGADFV